MRLIIECSHIKDQPLVLEVDQNKSIEDVIALISVHKPNLVYDDILLYFNQ